MRVLTIFINKEFKAVLSENLKVFYEYIFTDSSEVKFLRAANIKGTKQQQITDQKGNPKQHKAEFII